jgi:hypothetical protein
MFKRPILQPVLVLQVVLMWISGTVSSASAATTRSPPPPLPGLALGETTLHEALVTLGPADGIGLTGNDGQGGGGPNDDFVLRYETPFKLVTEHPATLALTFDRRSSRLKVLAVQFRDPAGSTLDEVTATYGSQHRVLRQDMAVDPDGLEASLSDCDSPTGPYLSWIYKPLGLQVELFAGTAAEPRVSGLRFALSIWSGAEAYPPCGK